MEAIPLSLAIIKSDGTEVLRHVEGSEPAAAQALRQVLQLRHPAMEEDTQQAPGEASSSACSFLAALLGPKIADAAISRAHAGRSWRGSITMHLPCAFISGSSRAPDGSSTATVTGSAEAAVATAGLAGGNEIELAKSALRAYVKKSSLKRGTATEQKDPVRSLERAPKKTNSFKSVRWGSLQTEPESSFQHEQEKALFMLSTEIGDPPDLALHGGLHTGKKASSPSPLGLGNISAPVYVGNKCGSRMETEVEGPAPVNVGDKCGSRTETGVEGSAPVFVDDKCGSRTETDVEGSDAAEAKTEASLPPVRRSKSVSDLRFARQSSQGSQSPLLRSERDLEQFMLNDDVNSPRTKAFLRSLLQKMEAADEARGLETPFKRASRQLPFIRRAPSTPQAGDGNSLHDALGLNEPAPPAAEHNGAPARAAPGALEDTQELVLQSFDIVFLALESTAAVPGHIADLAHAHKGVTLLFMDIVGFTSMCKNVEPVDVMVFLNTLFSLFDQLTDIHGVHKVETAGDCYIVSGGILSPKSSKEFGLVVEDQDPLESAARVMEFAKAMLDAAQQVMMPDTKQPVRVRVGMHTGNVVSGLIGSKLPKFTIFGDTMCTASRMESTGVPGRIHVSETTHELLQHSELWEPTGGVEVKGKGLMQTFLWVPQPNKPPSTSQVLLPIIEKPDSEISGTLPGVLLKTTHALFNQLHKSAPSFHPAALGSAQSSQDHLPSESEAFSCCLLERQVGFGGKPASM
ncbi:hypothetical protein DUNSADRAFT_6451 [Dunaliella salina]|uniref:Guanylate cyclase domain-containing protein n=1 Tax=Dunaliella salina TaxID=3046 RepID=A0ABQ7H6X6_DUNSA|nr:hypothetical protein DUNSADRAFT_6451 [Dunaliella salina]|eukprot:KAF5842601.1 hypothetical protein DUNSADRAFT_6451 [Dunaliella salina]